MVDDTSDEMPCEEDFQDYLATEERARAELASIKARILAEPTRMKALGVFNRRELDKIGDTALRAYGNITGIIEPKGAMVPGTNLPINGDTILEAADAIHAALIPFLQRGTDPTDLVIAIMNVALRPIMAAPSPEERAGYYELAIKILGNVPLKKASTVRAGHALELEPGVSVERKRYH